MRLFEAAKVVRCADAAEKLGFTVKRLSAERATMCCPFHDEKTPSLYMYMKPNRSTFYCFGCHKSGDAADLYAWHYSIPVKQAAAKVCADFNVPYEFNPKTPDEPLKTAPCPEVKILASAVNHWRNLNARRHLDRYEAYEAAMHDLMDHGKELSPQFDALLKKASAAYEEYQRWNCMSVAGILQEIQSEISAHLGGRAVLIPYWGVVQ